MRCPQQDAKNSQQFFPKNHYLPQMSGNPNFVITPIRELRPAFKQFNLECLVIDIFRDQVVRQDNTPMYTVWIGDFSGSIVLTLWGPEFANLNAGIN